MWLIREPHLWASRQGFAEAVRKPPKRRLVNDHAFVPRREESVSEPGAVAMGSYNSA